MATEPPLTPDKIDRIYRTEIRSLLFGSDDVSEPQPTLVLLGGQPGSGKSRAGARLTQDHDGIVAVSGDDLRIFHPAYQDLIHADPENAGLLLAEATREWVRNAIQDAIEYRRSLLLEGTFGDPDVTLATTDRFRQAGFHVRIVAIASPRVLSVITAASRYLRDLKEQAPARFTSLAAHDRGYDGTTRLIESLDAAKPADRVTILSRNGRVLDDHNLSSGPAPSGSAHEALRQGRHPETWGARSTMELLGELKQITNYAISSGNLRTGVAALLSEAHTLALEEVAPRLSVSADSPQARFLRQALTEQAVSLQRAIDRRTDRPFAEAEPQPSLELGRLDR